MVKFIWTIFVKTTEEGDKGNNISSTRQTIS